MTIFGVILFASVILTSCSNGGSFVTELEKCLGETKTLEQLKQLSKDEAVKMAQCMLPHIESFQSELDNYEGEAREALIESFNAKVKNSEYKEVLNAMNPDKIKKLAEED